MVKVSLPKSPQSCHLFSFYRDLIRWLLRTVTEDSLNLRALVLVIRNLLIKLICHELLFLNAFKDRVVVHKGLECLLSRQWGGILRSRAVGNRLKPILLLNIDNVGGNITESPITSLQVWPHVITELERACIAQRLKAHLRRKGLLFQHVQLAVKIMWTRMVKSRSSSVPHNFLSVLLLVQVWVAAALPGGYWMLVY